jgi:hypothetical protein
MTRRPLFRPAAAANDSAARGLPSDMLPAAASSDAGDGGTRPAAANEASFAIPDSRQRSRGDAHMRATGVIVGKAGSTAPHSPRARTITQRPERTAIGPGGPAAALHRTIQSHLDGGKRT